MLGGISIGLANQVLLGGGVFLGANPPESGPPPTPPPANTVAPVIAAEGTGSTTEATVGVNIQRTSDGTWDPAGDSYAFQWYRNGSPMPGETGTSLGTGMMDPGNEVYCEVTATNGGGSVSANSNTILLISP
jgi:hypothetical protein